jgi:hypothetical protein
MNTYLILFPTSIDRSALVAHLESLPKHGRWYHCLPNSVFVNSGLSVVEIRNDLLKTFGASLTIVVVKLTDGEFAIQMPQGHIDLLINKSHS